MTTNLPRARRRATAALPVALALFACLACLAATPLAAQRPAPRAARLDSLRGVAQRLLDSLRADQHIPGLTLGVALPDGRTFAVASGEADTARHEAMRPDHRLLQGSVGKTYVAAVAMQLVAEGKLDLDARVSRYLGELPWFSRLPNARDITVRQLMNHTSGLVRYEFNPAVADALRRDPYRVWTPEARLAVLLDTPAPFAAGQGWEYSDTNYIVLGMIIERLTGRPFYDELRRRVLRPLGLRNTIPSDRPVLPMLANGYAGPQNELGGYDASIVRDAKGARFAVNPQFEWTGGGMASTTEELARWGKLMYEGKAFDPKLLPTMLDAVPAKLGPGVKYGLGVIVRPTPFGTAWGHSGFFPGYATEMLYFPDARIAVAVQANSTNPYPRRLSLFTATVAHAIAGGKWTPPPADTSARAVMLRLMTESAAAWNRGDLDAHVALYADSAAMMTANGPMVGRDRIRAALERAFWKDGQPKGTLRFSDLAVTMLGPAHAMVTGGFELASEGAAPQRGRFTTIWARTPDGRWRIVHDHSS